MSGLFKLYDTHGLPLAVLLDTLHSQGYVVAYGEFVKEGLKSGWKEKTILSRLEEAVVEVHGRVYWDEVHKRLKL